MINILLTGHKHKYAVIEILKLFFGFSENYSAEIHTLSKDELCCDFSFNLSFLPDNERKKTPGEKTQREKTPGEKTQREKTQAEKTQRKKKQIEKTQGDTSSNEDTVIVFTVEYPKPDINIISSLDLSGTIKTCSDNLSFEESINPLGNDFIKLQKRIIKSQLYQILSAITGRTFPWGSLTGIRPTLMARESGYNTDVLINKYFLHPEKASLAVEVGKTEEFIMDGIPRDSVHLYISVPICATRCDYCSFPTLDLSKTAFDTALYVDALVDELVYFFGKYRFNVGSIYVGGGTPTVLPEAELEYLLQTIKKLVEEKEKTEFTVEAGRPDSITYEKAAIMKNADVNRICLNPQTFIDRTLKAIGRNHNSEDIYKAMDMIKSFGFETVNMDLIAGLEGETPQDLNYSIKCALDLEPENVTIHSLCIKRASKMKSRVLDAEKDYYRGFLERGEGLMATLHENYALLKKRGYFPYYMYRQKDIIGGNENIGFAKIGHESIYNCAMMGDRHTVMGFGAKAMNKFVIPDRTDKTDKTNKTDKTDKSDIINNKTEHIAENTTNNRIERSSVTADIYSYINNREEVYRKKEKFFYDIR